MRAAGSRAFIRIRSAARRHARILRVIIACALLALVALAAHPERLLASIGSADPWTALTALALVPLNLLFQQRKWEALLRTVSDLPRRDLRHRAWQSLLAGMTAGFLTPARLGEFGGRLRGLSSFGAARITVLAATDKAFSFLGAVSLGAGISSVAAATNGVLPVPIAVAIGMISLSAFWLLPWIPPVPARVADGVHTPGKEGKDSSVLRSTARRLIRLLLIPARMSGDARLRLCAGTTAFHLVYLAQSVLLIVSFGGGAYAAALGAGMLLLARTLLPQLTAGDVGVREAAAVLVFGAAGIPAATAFNASLVLWTINALLPAIAGTLTAARPMPQLGSPEEHAEGACTDPSKPAGTFVVSSVAGRS